MVDLEKRFGSDVLAKDGVIISQQPSVNGLTGRVLQILVADVVALDKEQKRLFSGLIDFLRAKPVQNYDALERGVFRIVSDLRIKASRLGANAVLNVQIEITRGVGVQGERLIRLSAVGTAVILPA